MIRFVLFAICCGSLLIDGARADEAKPAVDFARQIQPIFASRCAKCHGPAEAKGGIAFDEREHALAKTESGEPAIVPGHPERSGLIERITATDDAIRMPPEGKPLTPHEVELLRNWISAGAEWAKPWAFRPVTQPPVPVSRTSTWGRNAIDAFVLQGLEKARLTPNPPADKRTLIRRAYYNLLGLPPTVEQVEAFVNDGSPDAWEKLVDSLLASPQYGEHWGRKWLDVVRYAETNSFERDNPKPHVWRYRDYVIRSFNSDKPYDIFLREQLAGDEMPHAGADQLIATGFYRLGAWDDEPADRELALYDGYDDLITTVGQGMLGLTLNCARCHNHKIDPVSQADYYQLVTFFRNIIPMQTGGPEIEEKLFSSAQSRAEHEAAERDRQEQLEVNRKEVARLEEIFSLMLARGHKPGDDLELAEYRLYRRSFDNLPDFDKLKPDGSGAIPERVFDIGISKTDREFGFVFTGQLKIPADGEYTFHLDSDDGSRLTVDGRTLITYDGIHGTGQEKHAKTKLTQGTVPIRVDYFQRHHGYGLLLSFHAAGQPRRFLTPRDGSQDANNEVRRKDLAKLMDKRGLELLGEDEFEKYRTARKRLEELKKDTPVEKALVVKERGRDNVPDTFVLVRGTPGNHAAKVEPGFPKLFESPAAHVEPVKAASSGRRSALASWIASRENRLTARVLVNRIWQGHFGRGIVRSANNFGGIGTPPTHPELLDYLAADFMEHDWQVKRMHRQIMLSQAWQMSSAGNEEALRRDPANDLFWRFDMRRLSGEEVRDSLLATSGQLNTAMFGPSIYPAIQAEVLAGQSRPGAGWGKSSPEEQARRSVYIHVKRSLITPLLASFDFPETDVSCEARFATTQPGQSFAMLNGAFANEQAHAFAARLKRETGSDDETKLVGTAYRLALGRNAEPVEIARATRLMQRLREQHGLSTEQALDQFALFMLNLNEYLYLD